MLFSLYVENQTSIHVMTLCKLYFYQNLKFDFLRQEYKSIFGTSGSSETGLDSFQMSRRLGVMQVMGYAAE